MTPSTPAGVRTWRMATALLAAAMSSLPAMANLVSNGDFEAPTTSTFFCFGNTTIGGWTNTRPAGTAGSCYTHVDGPAAPAYSGNQSIYLNDNSMTGVTLSQGLSVTAGQAYQMVFALTGLTDRPTLPVVQVDAGAGSSPALFTGLPFGQWSLFNYGFTAANTGTTPLTFTARSGYIYLDAVQVQTVPEPSAAWLLPFGLLGLAMGARKRSDDARAHRPTTIPP